MRKFYKFLLAIFVVSCITLTASAQQRYWSLQDKSSVTATDKAVARQSFPKEFKVFGLDISPLKQELFSIVGNLAARRTTVISLPNADGGMEDFEVFEASNFEPALQARYPDIRAFSGKGITDKYATLKLSISPQGIQTMVFRTDKDNEFIEPYSQDHKVYAVFKSHRERGKLPWTCSTEDQQMADDITPQIPSTGRPFSSTGELKVFRLAQSCNGEYANWFGATAPSQEGLVMAAFNATLSRCNGCYEKDLAVHLDLIDLSRKVIFYNPATDPYSAAVPPIFAGLDDWNLQLQRTLTDSMGSAAYDIGHMFGAAGGGGNAGCIGCVCVDPPNYNSVRKGGGITSPGDGIPQGDNFDIDYVVHEIGHQLGANHTYSHGNEGTGVNKEVGSGITIMGYAGITPGFDIAPHSIDIYHEASIQQIQTNLATKTCGTTTNISANNATPVVSPVSNYTIPISTPFALTGSATDANAGDALTYCWEQNDNVGSGGTGSGSSASPIKTAGPNFISWSPTASPTRVFPRLSTILAGNLTTAQVGGDAGMLSEALSSVNRTLNFRLTVRDNSPYSSNAPVKVGQTAFTDMVVTVTNSSGPFAITAPNTTGISWPGSSSQAVTWNVANTTAAPVSCANVNILLSTDGGQTFPTVLVANTPNDGSENVTVPNINSTTCRIKVESVGNIFFDINNANFSIVISTPSYDFDSPAATNVDCAGPTSASVTLGTQSFAGYTTPIALTASGNPAGTTVSFSPNPVTPGNSTTVTLNGTNTLTNGSYTITVTGTSGANIKTRNLTFVVQTGTGPSISAQPQPQAICVGSTANFSVTASGALSYQWQLSTDGGANFTNITSTNSASYTTAAVTTTMNNYQYRVIITGQCNTTTSSAGVLTVRTAPSISSQPANATLCVGATANFSVTAAGTNITYQWQQSTDGGTNYSAAPGTNTNSSYTTPTLTTGMNNYRYRVVVSGTCTPAATSTAAVLTVISPVVVSTQPTAQTICETGNVTFTTAGTSTQTVLYQWQVSTDGGTNYTNIPGAANATLDVNAVTAGMNNNRYRALLSSATCATPTVTNAVILTVDPRPVVTLAAAPLTSLLPGQTTTLTATVTPGNLPYTITWYKDNNVIQTGGLTYVVDSVAVGDYKASVIFPATGCNNESSVVSITTSASERLFIFPSPNNGQFTISYYNSTGAATQQTVRIFDAHGAVVYSARFPVNGQYTLHNVVMRNVAAGVYVVVVGDASGKRLVKEKVLVAARP